MKVSIQTGLTLDFCRSFTYEGTKEDVDHGDEHLSEEETLPEIHRVTHLRQESNKQQSTTVRVHHGVDSIELRCKTNDLLLILRGWRSGKGSYRLDYIDQGRLKDDRVLRTVVRAGNEAELGQYGRSIPARFAYTHMMMNDTTLSQTERLHIQPMCCSARMLPEIMPMIMMINMTTT
jgi:hypothetical protein